MFLLLSKQFREYATQRPLLAVAAMLVVVVLIAAALKTVLQPRK